MSKTTENPLELLRANNPFTVGVASAPWEETHRSVDSINRCVFDNLLSLIRQKRERPRDNMAALVLGDAGMGKTHFLKRIFDAIKPAKDRTAFVSVQNILNPEEPMRRLLYEIVSNLDKTVIPGSPYSQLDYLLADIQREYLKLRFTESPSLQTLSKKNKEVYEAIQTDPLALLELIKTESSCGHKLREHLIPWFDRHFPQVEQSLLKVLFQYRVSDKRKLARNWLRGDILDQDDVAKLGVPERPYDRIHTVEDECRRLIISLGLLLEHSDRTIVVCFDQLDSLRGDRIAAYGEMSLLLADNSAPAMLPVSFIQIENWQLKFISKIQSTARTRLEVNQQSLKGCTIDEARELIDSRIQFRFRDRGDVTDLCQWMSEKMRGNVQEGDNPRTVISTANKILLHGGNLSPSQSPSGAEYTAAIPTAAEVLLETYEQEIAKIQAEWSTQYPDAEKLRESLEHYLAGQNFQSVLQTKESKEDSKYVAPRGTWTTATGETVPCAFLVNTTYHAAAITASLNRGIFFLKRHRGQNVRCFFITDARCNMFPPSWRVAGERRREFETIGGRILFLSQSEVIRWFALYSLKNKIFEQDIQVGDRVATEDDFHQFILTGLPYPHFDWDSVSSATDATDIVPPSSSSWKVSAVVSSSDESQSLQKKTSEIAKLDDKIAAIVRQSPMNTLLSSVLLHQLCEQGFAGDMAWLHQYLGDNKDKYTLCPNKTGFLIFLNRSDIAIADATV